MTRSLWLRLIAWYCGAVGSITALPWIAPVLSESGLDEGQVATALILLPIGALIGGPAWLLANLYRILGIPY